MKTIKLLLASAMAVLTMGTVCALPAVAENTTAETYDINDVADALRDACVPESQIQQMLNVYQYCEKDENGIYFGDYYYRYDETVWTIELMGVEAINAAINENLEAGLKKYEEIMATATTTTQTTVGSNNGSATTTTTTTTTKTFEEMTMDEKIAYLYSLPEAEREAFIANLSVDEKQSILLQMSTNDQMEVLDYIANLMKELGFHMSVDNMQQGQIDVSLRDDQGNLIDSSSMGIVVEDTGWNLTGWFAAATVLVLAAIGGIGYVMYRTGKHTEEEENG